MYMRLKAGFLVYNLFTLVVWTQIDERLKNEILYPLSCSQNFDQFVPSFICLGEPFFHIA